MRSRRNLRQHNFSFKADLSKVDIPSILNNPFGSDVPEIARIASEEFQQHLCKKSGAREILSKRGRMFGVLVVRKADLTYAYLAAISGNLEPGLDVHDKLLPSIFDDSTDDYFIIKGMVELTELNERLRTAVDEVQIKHIREGRKVKSNLLQKKLFENYRIRNIHGDIKNVLQIFKRSDYGNPPSAAGECAAPKMLQYALKNNLKPVALAEFWWGKAPKSKERKHKEYYPACKSKCRPILEYMLDDFSLYGEVNSK